MVIGTGPLAEPVLRLAAFAGWQTTLVDYRDTFINQRLFERVNKKVLTPPESLKSAVDLSSIDALLLMTHEPEYDERYLKHLVDTKARYIGFPGPAGRSETLLNSLGDHVAQIQDRVFAPAGLDTGGSSPGEIAVSIIAEVQAILYQRDGQPISRKNTGGQSQADQSIDNLYAIVLAAGAATRFGGLKQMLEYEGQSLLSRSVKAATGAVERRVKVVLGARARKIQRNIESRQVGIIHNDNWERGIASSIEAGLNSLPDECDGILLILCDQALVGRAQLESLINTWQTDKSRIVASAFTGTVSTPAVIPRSLFPDLLKLQGDSGVESLFTARPDLLETVNIPEAEVDIDTQEDYLHLISAAPGNP